MSNSSATRRLEVDGLRALAALWVMCDHFGLSARVGMHYGFLAVRLMLVLSAYFAARQLRNFWATRVAPVAKESAAAKLVHYYTSRVVRLGLMAYVTILIAILIDGDGARSTWKWHATFATNEWIRLHSDWPGCLSHFWSLAIQMQFLLVLPLAFFLIGRRALPWMILASVGMALVHRVFSVTAPVDDFFRWMPLINSLDAFAIGVGLAWIEQERPQWFAALARPRVWLGALACLAGMHWIRGASYYSPLGVITETGEALALALLFGAILTGFTFGPVGSFLRWKPLVKLGTASLSLYALHPIVERFLSRVAGTSETSILEWGLPFQFLTAGLAILAAWGAFWLVEIPARKLAAAVEAAAGNLIPRLLSLPCPARLPRQFQSAFGTLCLSCLMLYASTASLRVPSPMEDFLQWLPHTTGEFFDDPQEIPFQLLEEMEPVIKERAEHTNFA